MVKTELKIERGITKIEINIPDLNRRIAFTHPFEGPNFYREVCKAILNNKIAKLSLPDGEKTSFLLHVVYCGTAESQAQPEAVEIREQIMRPKYLWIFQRNIWIPEKYKAGVFVIYDEKGEGLSRKIEELDIGELEKALKGGRKLKNGIKFSEDGKVAFAPRKTYKGGEMDYEEFAKDGFIIVSCKETGARNLAEVSKSDYFIIKKPHSFIVEPDKEPIQTLSALDGYRGCRLGFGGDCHVGDRFGCAFGVLE